MSMVQIGNSKVNADLEFHVPGDTLKPLPEEGREVRQKYIEAKYRDREFVKEKAPISESVIDILNDGSLVKSQSPVRLPPRQREVSTSQTAPDTRDKRNQGMILYDGILTVDLLSARELSTVVTPLASVKAQLTVGNRTVESGGSNDLINPLWRESFSFSCKRTETLSLSVVHSTLLLDEVISGCRVDLSGLPPDQSVLLRIPLVSKSKASWLEFNWRDVVNDPRNLGDFAQSSRVTVPEGKNVRPEDAQDKNVVTVAGEHLLSALESVGTAATKFGKSLLKLSKGNARGYIKVVVKMIVLNA